MCVIFSQLVRLSRLLPAVISVSECVCVCVCVCVCACVCACVCVCLRARTHDYKCANGQTFRREKMSDDNIHFNI